MNNYKNLKVWQLSMEVAEEVYHVTATFPKAEIYGLTSQVRRCVVSIASNIAEGACRNNEKEFNHFLGIAAGSTGEAETQILLSMRLNYLTTEQYQSISTNLASIQKMLYALKKNLTRAISVQDFEEHFL